MSDGVSLPIIDLAKARDPGQRLAVARQLVNALETVGFLFLDNVAGYDADLVLRHAKWFFKLPQPHKDRLVRNMWNPRNKNHYRGYFPTIDGEVSFKEGFEMGQERAPLDNAATQATPPFFVEPNPWPEDVDGSEQFQQDMAQYFRAMHACSLEILRLVSVGCGLEESWFDSLFLPDSLSTLRLQHYPPRADSQVPLKARDGDNVICTGEHSDTGFVTLLATFNYAGLEIRHGERPGEWLAVPERPQSLVMNIGDMLSEMSGGRFKATKHRVLDIRISRFSVPFFLEPYYTADISKTLPAARTSVANKDDKAAVKKTYGPLLLEKMRGFAEYTKLLQIFGL